MTDKIRFDIYDKQFRDDYELKNGECTINIDDINVTLPIIYIKLIKISTSKANKKTVYTTAYRLHWEENNLSEKRVVISAYKMEILMNKTNNIITNTSIESCENSNMFKILKKCKIELIYVWKENNSKTPLNEKIEDFNKMKKSDSISGESINETVEEDEIIEADENFNNDK